MLFGKYFKKLKNFKTLWIKRYNYCFMYILFWSIIVIIYLSELDLYIYKNSIDISNSTIILIITF